MTNLQRRPRLRAAVAGAVALVLGGGILVACTGTNAESSADSAGDWSAAGAAAETGAGGAADAGAAERQPAAQQGESQAAPTKASDPDGDAGNRSPDAGDDTTGSGSGSDGQESGSGSGSRGGSGPATSDRAQPPSVLDGRAVIRTASFTIEVTVERSDDHEADQRAVADKVAGVATRARAVATGLGGYVSASDGQGATRSVTLRIPAASYDTAREQLAGLGDLHGSESSQDVTGSLADMDGRIATMKAGIKRLRHLLTKAEDISDVIAIESELTQREADLEALMRERAAMADQVALSTITLVVSGAIGTSTPGEKAPFSYTPTPLASAGPSGFTGAMLTAVDMLQRLGAGIVTFLGGLLPFLPLLLVLAIVVPWLRRRYTAVVGARRSGTHDSSG